MRQAWGNGGLSAWNAQSSESVRRSALPRSSRVRSSRAFTLIETLVVVAIIALLLAALMPVLRGVRGSMHSLKCASNLRTVSIQFQLFAQGEAPEGRGDSAALGSSFRINDFQDYLYRIDEFWRPPEVLAATQDRDAEPTVCPAGPGPLRKLPGATCGRAAFTPLEHVTLAVNMRLSQPARPFNGRWVLAPAGTVRVRDEILNHPYVPLALDVDARRAASRGIEPFYTAPPRPGAPDPYSNGRFWIPAVRHDARTNVAFVGGHVLSSARPEKEPWHWGYEAHVGN